MVCWQAISWCIGFERDVDKEPLKGFLESISVAASDDAKGE